MRPFEAYPIFLDLLRASAGSNLLDVSCGAGFLLKAATQRGIKAYGIDISDEAVTIARKTAPAAEIQVGKGEDLPFPDQTFEFLTCIGSLEHFIDMEKGLEEMRRVTKSGARLCIVVPNSKYLPWQIFGQPGTEQQAINEHLMSLDAWSAKFSGHSFRIAAVHQDRWPAKERPVFGSRNPVRMLKRALFQLMWVFLPLRYTYQFIFILERPE